MNHALLLWRLHCKYFQETAVDVTDPFEGAEAEEETDFQPSNPAPYFYNGPQLQLVKPLAPINTLALDSNFGVAVTPIQVDTVIFAIILLQVFM